MWAEIGSELVSTKFLVLYGYVACVTYVHFRGKVRLRFTRQLSEHSGLLAPYNCLMYAFSKVSRRPILKVEDFPQLAILRENWQVIRDEAQKLFEGGHIDYRDSHQDLAFVAFKRRGWKRFYLKWYDDFMPSARALCPKTVELVSKIPDMNAAAFTMLPPGTKLGKHRDPLAGSVRYHLGLITPNSDKCRIWIDGHEYSWRDGQDIVFDETYIHWAENETDQHRIIFFADVTRPLHTPVMRGISAFMNKWVFSITKSTNLGTDPVGVLNRVTPVVYRLKNFFLAAKAKNRPAYMATKFVLVAGLVYVVFLRGFLAH